MRRLMTAALAVTVLSGCASLQHTFGPGEGDKVYIGTKKNWSNITDKGCGGAIACEGLNPIVDLPLSAVMDTLLLPYTVTDRLTKSDSSNKAPAPEPLVAQQAVPDGRSSLREARR